MADQPTASGSEPPSKNALKKAQKEKEKVRILYNRRLGYLVEC